MEYKSLNSFIDIIYPILMPIQIVFKGEKYDVILQGNSIDEIKKEYEKLKGDIEKLVGKVPLMPHSLTKQKGKKR